MEELSLLKDFCEHYCFFLGYFVQILRAGYTQLRSIKQFIIG